MMALFRMFTGYLAACLTVVLAAEFVSHLNSLSNLPIAPSAARPGQFKLVGWAWAMVAVLTLVPATIAINYAKENGKRSVGFFVAAGGLIGMFWPVFVTVFLLLGTPGPVEIFRMALGLGYFACLGALAGIVYWAIAGRRTEHWPERASNEGASRPPAAAG